MTDANQTPVTKQPRTVVIAGGNGFLGRSLSRELLQHGDHVVCLCRPGRWGIEGTQTLEWDAKTLGPWASALDGADVLVNLVGRSVDCRKTPEQKQEIMNSRVDSCHVLGQACRDAANPPKVWLQTGTAHIHGDPLPEDTLIVDDSPFGEGLAPEVGIAWEKAFNEAKLPEQRGVISRTSFVLGADGGALDKLQWLTTHFLGGTVGSGKQYISWIHEDDMNRFWLKAMTDETMSGTYLVTAPNPVTNRAFMREMRRAWGMPWSPPAPSVMVKLGAKFILNTDPELALLGRRCEPKRLVEETGFEFRWPDIGPALADLKTKRATAGL